MEKHTPLPLRSALVLSLGLLILIIAAPALPATAQQPDAAAALLTVEDLPEGWVLASEQPQPNERGIEDPCGQDSAVQPLSLAQVKFQPEDHTATVDEAVAMLQPGDAARALDYIRAQTENCGAPLSANVRVSSLAVPALGDDSVAARIETGEGADAVDVHLVAARRGDTFFLLVHSSTPGAGPVDPQLTERLALLVDERLATVAGE